MLGVAQLHDVPFFFAVNRGLFFDGEGEDADEVEAGSCFGEEEDGAFR